MASSDGALIAAPAAPPPSPMWLGRHRMAAWWHQPADGQARAGIILCPSLGAEQLWSYRALVLLAERLADCGFAVLRIDWPGTGHSAHDLGGRWIPGGLAEALEDAASAVRSAGVRNVGAVGFRLGGLVVAAAGASAGLDLAVLWDPVASGRQWIRQQHLLQAVSLEQVDAEELGNHSASDLQIPGFDYASGAQADLLGLAIDRTAPRPARRTLLLHRSTLGARALDDLVVATGAETAVVDDSDELLYEDRLPEGALSLVVREVGAAFGAERAPIDVPVGLTVLDIGNGVTERFRRIGPHGLTAVETRPAAVDPSLAPVCFVGTANEPCVGPGRLWVQLARQLAASGRLSLRFDLGGIADSPGQPNGLRFDPYNRNGPRDVMDAAESVAPSGTPVVLVGSCSGAYNALEAALRRERCSVIAINPILDAPAARHGGGGIGTPPRWLFEAMRRSANGRPSSSVPEWAWRVAHLLKLQRSPATGLRIAVASGTELMLLCGPTDARRYIHRGSWIVRALQRQGTLDFRIVAGLDHALLGGARSSVEALVLDRLGAGHSPAPTGEPARIGGDIG